MKIPTTIAELEQVASLPYNQANGLISRADDDLVKQWGFKIYSNFGNGYLHSSDHIAALRIILNREPTFREVYDSYHKGGSKNIDLAREKMGAGLRPTEWDNWTDEQKKYSVLVHLNGITTGSRILDGKRKDPNPEKTKALMELWGLKLEPDKPVEPEKPVEPREPKEPEKPVEPDKPIDPINPINPINPSLEILPIEIKVKQGDKVYTFRMVEVKT